MSIYSADRISSVSPTDGSVSSNGYPRKRARTRRQLLIAGMQELAAHGPDGTTIAQVAHRAHVSTGTFYNHFDSLGTLVGAIVDELASGVEIARDVLAQMEHDPAALLAIGTRQLLDLARTDPPTASAFVNLLATVPAFRRRVQATVRTAIADGIAAGRFEHRPAEITADAVIGVVTQWMRSRLIGEFNAALESDRLVLVLEIAGLPRTDAEAVVDHMSETLSIAATATSR